MFLRQLFVIVLFAIICAVVANQLASNQRKLSWIGDYPNAFQLPAGQTSSTDQPNAPTHPGAKQAASPSAQQPPQPGQQQQQQQSPQAPPVAQPGTASTISGDDAWSLFLQQAVFLDARRTDDYAGGHIARARSFAVWEGDIDQKISDLKNQTPPDSPIVTYCSGGSCEDSTILAEKLAAAGFSRIYVYHGGYPEWKDQGRPVETGGGK